MKRGSFFKVLTCCLLAFGALSLSACGSDKSLSYLTAPENIQVYSQDNKTYIQFNAVENASYYIINVNGTTVNCPASSDGVITFDASKICVLPQGYVIKIKACGKDGFIDSDYSVEYQYTNVNTLKTPILSFNGTVLIWDKVENASYYKIMYTHNGTTDTYTSSVNKFDFTNIINDVGVYTFKVSALSTSSEFAESEYANATYTNRKTLSTPKNVELEYSQNDKCIYASFVGDENATNYELTINGKTYVVPKDSNNVSFQNYENVVIQNLVKINITSLLKEKNEDALNVSVSIKSTTENSVDSYYNSSMQSETKQISIKTRLNAPTISSSNTNAGVKLQWGSIANADGYRLYKNGLLEVTVSKDILSVEISNANKDGNSYYLQAYSNGEYQDSVFSNNISFASNNLQDVELKYENGILSWDAISNCNYTLEISNEVYSKQYSVSNDFDLTNFDAGNYNIKLICQLKGYKPVEKTIKVSIGGELVAPSNVSFGQGNNKYTLTFDRVDNAKGYLVYLGGTPISKLFTENAINLYPYIAGQSATNFVVKVRAIGKNNYYLDSLFSSSVSVKYQKTLMSPINLRVNSSKHLLFDEVNGADSYTIVLNNKTIYNKVSYIKEGFDISSYLSTAGVYRLQVKANAPADREDLLDSNFTQYNYSYIVQLDVVKNVSVINQNGKYKLSFTMPSMMDYVENYQIKIVKDNETTSLVNINNTYCDITSYIMPKGEYKIYITTKAIVGGFYLDSQESPEPFVLNKITTLADITNVEYNRSSTENNEFIWQWDRVENASSYLINVYKQGEELELIDSLSVEDNFVNLANQITTEQEYFITARAIGDNINYESSSIYSNSYVHSLIYPNEFARLENYMYGNDINYKVSSIEQLKNLLWYHYLYNDKLTKLNDQEYNMKIYIDMSLEYAISEYESLYGTLADESFEEICYELLKLYPMGVSLDENGFTLTRGIYDKVYTAKFKTNIGVDTSLNIYETNLELMKNIVDELSAKDKRSSRYVFRSDALDPLEVSTSEQLYMALQYNKKPVFAQDCNAKTIYENAKKILIDYVNDSMNNFKKVEVIFNYLMSNIKYNYTFENYIKDKSVGDNITDSRNVPVGNYKYMYLESVLLDLNNQIAGSRGLAQAFAVLCKIENIDAIMVKGETHYFNKVKLNIDGEDKWYVVDLAKSRANAVVDSVNYQLKTYSHFLTIDEENELWSVDSQAKAVDDGSDYYFYNTTLSYGLSGTLKTVKLNCGTNEDEAEYVKKLLTYGYLKGLGENSVIINARISTTDLDNLCEKIKSQYYSQVKGELNLNYEYAIDAVKVDSSHIVLCFNPKQA